MALSIRNVRVERLAREVAKRTGESITRAIEHALKERLSGLRTDREKAVRLRAVQRIVARISRAPDRDRRSADEILGYDQHGLPR
jgi:antitoxin VapB